MSDATLKQREPPDRPWSAMAAEWLRENLLFSSWAGILLTLLSIAFIVVAVPPILDWAIFSAVWAATPARRVSARARGRAGPTSPTADR
ncbi:MAG: hypothetical protein U1F24_05960 [Alphaproteobacteria bacterium]